jgi:hypothetical protein
VDSYTREEVVEGFVKVFVLHRVLYPQVHANGFKKKNGVRPSTTITEQRGTYSTKQGFPTELLPSPTLLRIPNIVRMEFKLKQVIGDTFHSSYALIDPLPIIYMHLVRALVPVRRSRRIVVSWLRRMLARLRFVGSFYDNSGLVSRGCVLSDEPLLDDASPGNAHVDADRGFLD